MFTQLFEKYRPTSLDQVIGQPKAVAQLKLIHKRHGTFGGRAYWISGESGRGKTTLAMIIASMSTSDDINVTEVDATGWTAGQVKEAMLRYQTMPLGGGCHVVIVNESHGLSAGAMRMLLTHTEAIPPHVVLVFTTTIDGEKFLFDKQDDCSALMSRMTTIKLAARDLKKLFASRAQDIAELEGLGGKPAKAYVTLCEKLRNNFRAVLTAIEAGEMMTEESLLAVA